MLSFLAKHPPRSKTAHHPKLFFDGRLSQAWFKGPRHRLRMVNRLPPALSASEFARLRNRQTKHPSSLPPAHQGANSSLAPPLHRHWSQDETFLVIEGTAKFTLGREGKTRLAGPGETVVIPRREAHTFCNASEKEELVIEFFLDPPGREDAYLRNIWGYRNDCKRAGTPPSLFQTLSFMYSGGVVKVLPGPEIVSQWLGYVLNYVGGFLIGRLLLGYRGSYPEYFRETVPLDPGGFPPEPDSMR